MAVFNIRAAENSYVGASFVISSFGYKLVRVIHCNMRTVVRSSHSVVAHASYLGR